MSIRISSGRKTLTPDSGSRIRESLYSISKDARSPCKCIRKKNENCRLYFHWPKMCSNAIWHIFPHCRLCSSIQKHSTRGIGIKQLNEESMQQFLLLDIKQLDEESNPPIDIQITKRERKKERENLQNIYLLQQFLLLDVKQLNEKSNPPIDIHITKRKRERKRKRENLRNFYLLQQFLLLGQQPSTLFQNCRTRKTICRKH